jgi:hypothetical protein
MTAARSMRETDVTADVDGSGFHRGMRRVQAGPITTQMAEMKSLADETIFLLLTHFVEKQFRDNTKIEDD